MKFFLLFLTAWLIAAQAEAFTILIDPGHGGEEDGAIALTQGEDPPQVIKEKDIALVISKKIHELLRKKGFTVFLTRSVEKTKADLFISVHINSSTEKNAYGFETYYLDNHDDVAIKKVEKAENMQLKGDEVVVQQILVDLVVEQTVSTSKPLAESIHGELRGSVGRKYGIRSRGVKPGLFFVLALSKRPGVLLEVGFISTFKERVRMMNPKFQDEYASSVVKGIESYVNKKRKIVKKNIKTKKRK
jgi:N-acetylmuramoyl-L-alanine amidase